eukprot:4653704-Pleurochrysis_carterae.AAC.2
MFRVPCFRIGRCAARRAGITAIQFALFDAGQTIPANIMNIGRCRNRRCPRRAAARARHVQAGPLRLESTAAGSPSWRLAASTAIRTSSFTADNLSIAAPAVHWRVAALLPLYLIHARGGSGLSARAVLSIRRALTARTSALCLNADHDEPRSGLTPSNTLAETIFALSSGGGRAGVSVIRISGPQVHSP